MFRYGVWQDLYSQMKNEIPFLEFHQGFSSHGEMVEWGGVEGHKILVQDDLMIDAADNMDMVH